MKKLKREYSVEVFPAGRDFRGEAVLRSVRELGVKGVSRVRTGKIFILKYGGKEFPSALTEIAEKILTDAVCEKFCVGERKRKGVGISVFPKQGVFDAEGKTLMDALAIAGITGIDSVSCGMKYTLFSEKPLSPKNCAFVAEKLLYNGVIEKVIIKK